MTLPANPSSNHHYYRMKQLYPWLTHAFLDRVRYQVACAMLSTYSIREGKHVPYTKIAFGSNGARNLQIIHKGTVYNLEKIKADPFKYTRILTAIFEGEPA